MNQRAPRLKIVFVGETGTGKTSLINRYADDCFTGEVEPTIGGWGRPIKFEYQNHVLDLVIWDTAGQERYRGLTPMYYRNAIAAIVVFDVTNQESFDEVATWISELQAKAEDIVIVICGNKIDCLEERLISENAAEELAQELKAVYCEASAKSGLGVRNLFQTVVTAMISNRPELIEGGKGSKEIEVNDIEEVKKKCC